MTVSIYTRTGDSGVTALLGGERVSKSTLHMEVLGTLDELNSHLGLVIALLDKKEDLVEIRELLNKTQSTILAISGEIAGAKNQITEDSTKELEHAINTLQSGLPELHSFILPGGNPASAACHIARTVCRRTERLVVRLHESAPLNRNILKFLNRLSDLLFMMARQINSIA